MLLELAASLAQPALAALGPRHDPLLIKRELRLDRFLGLRRGQLLGGRSAQLLPSLAEELAASLGRLQLLGELITTRVPVQLILGLIGRLVLSHDLPGDLPEITRR